MVHEKTDIDIRVAKIFSAILKRTIRPTEEVLRESEANWNSLAHLELVMSIEDDFGVRLSPKQLELFTCKSWIIQELLDANGTV